MLPFVDGEAIGDVALLDENIVVEQRDVLDGPGCGLGNDVPKKNKGYFIIFKKLIYM